MFPQLAKEADITSLQAFIENDDWIFEQKLDGHRILLCSPGGDFPPSALTRNGSPYTRKLPQAIQDFRFPTDVGPMEMILDGELVGDTFWVFDIPLLPYALSSRRKFLEKAFQNVQAGEAIRLVPQAKTREEKIALAETALKENYEGLVVKNRTSIYMAGARNESWIKIKFVKTADCFVTAVRDDGKESVRLGMVADGDPRAICDVGRASLIGKEKNGTIAIGDVVEVRYLYTGAGGRLYQPTILRKRHDKSMHECTTDQLVMVNKEVLESL
jgi:bifunctional non-homologous end joining protein LigD